MMKSLSKRTGSATRSLAATKATTMRKTWASLPLHLVLAQLPSAVSSCYVQVPIQLLSAVTMLSFASWAEQRLEGADVVSITSLFGLLVLLAATQVHLQHPGCSIGVPTPSMGTHTSLRGCLCNSLAHIVLAALAAALSSC